MKVLGMFFICVGVLLILGTAGRSDMEMFAGMGIEESLPFWQILVQISGGLFLACVGKKIYFFSSGKR